MCWGLCSALGICIPHLQLPLRPHPVIKVRLFAIVSDMSMTWREVMIIGAITHPVEDVVLCQGHKANSTNPKDLSVSQGPACVKLQANKENPARAIKVWLGNDTDLGLPSCIVPPSAPTWTLPLNPAFSINMSSWVENSASSLISLLWRQSGILILKKCPELFLGLREGLCFSWRNEVHIHSGVILDAMLLLGSVQWEREGRERASEKERQAEREMSRTVFVCYTLTDSPLCSTEGPDKEPSLASHTLIMDKWLPPCLYLAVCRQCQKRCRFRQAKCVSKKNGYLSKPAWWGLFWYLPVP